MELQAVTDTAAKQAIDAIRAFKESVRVQRQGAARAESDDLLPCPLARARAILFHPNQAALPPSRNAAN